MNSTKYLLLGMITVSTHLYAMDTPLISAVEGTDEQKVSELLKEGVDPDGKGRFGITPLQQAVRMGKWNIVRLLLEHKANPNVVDVEKGSITPLHVAVRTQQAGIVNLLLEKKADPNIKNKDGEAPLSIVFEQIPSNQVEDVVALRIVESLLEHDANPNVKDKAGNLPLGIAMKSGKWEIAKLLLDNKADPSAIFTNYHGYTPLHYAVTRNRNMVPLLIKMGANPNIQDEYGKTPLDLAEQKYRETSSEENEKVVDSLKAYTKQFQPVKTGGATVPEPTERKKPVPPAKPTKLTKLNEPTEPLVEEPGEQIQQAVTDAGELVEALYKLARTLNVLENSLTT